MGGGGGGGQRAGPHCIRLGFTVCMIFSAGKKNTRINEGSFHFHILINCIYLFSIHNSHYRKLQ